MLMNVLINKIQILVSLFPWARNFMAGEKIPFSYILSSTNAQNSPKSSAVADWLTETLWVPQPEAKLVEPVSVSQSKHFQAENVC